MDKWHCPHCTEELLGAVNRCWRCGQRVTQPEMAAVAPHAEPSLPVAVAPEVAAVFAVTSVTAEEIGLAITKDPPRRGSPFGYEIPLVETKSHTAYYGEGSAYKTDTSRRPSSFVGPAPTRAAVYPRHTSAFGGTLASLLLGMMSAVLLFFTVLGGLTAAIGAACAVWGLYSRRKGLAMGALLLCCTIMMLAAWMLGFSLYTQFNPPGGVVPGGSGMGSP